MKFTKMHGIGNDYIYVNGFEEKIENPAEFAIKFSDRHKGIGSDGLVLILPSTYCDFRMQMLNADGSEAEMCGNAARCIGKYVYENGLTDKTSLTLETLSGIKKLELFLSDDKIVDRVTVDMGEPVMEANRIPIIDENPTVMNKMIRFSPSIQYRISCVSMGNPHAVIFTKNIGKLNLPKLGSLIENAPIFPNRINVEFIELISSNRFKMRVWERGSGETLACGTGACAAVVAGILNGFCDRRTTVELLGGELEIEWNAFDNHVYLTGTATTVFEGTI